MSGTLLPATAGSLKNPVPLLKQRIELLEKENELLHKKLVLACRKLAEAGGHDPQQLFESLVEDLRKAEEARRKAEEEALRKAEEEARQAQAAADSEPDKKPKTDKKKGKGHGPTEQPDLRRVEEIHNLPEDQRTCSHCDGELLPLGDQFEEYEEIHTIQREYVLKVVKCRKYRCRCMEGVVPAPGPQRLFPGGRYSTDFTVDVAVDKYCDHIPLARQVRRMARLGLKVTSQTLFDQLVRLVELLLPVYHELGRLLLTAAVLHADETRWRMLNRPRGSPSWAVWTRCTPDIAHYSLLSTKSAEAGRSLFEGYSGVVVVDGYAVYEKLAKENDGLCLANCWAHTLRKYADIRDNFKEPCDHVLSLISDLYDVEREVPGEFPGDEHAQQLRHRLRQEKSKPILGPVRPTSLTRNRLTCRPFSASVPMVHVGWHTRWTMRPYSTLQVIRPLFEALAIAASGSATG